MGVIVVKKKARWVQGYATLAAPHSSSSCSYFFKLVFLFGNAEVTKCKGNIFLVSSLVLVGERP